MGSQRQSTTSAANGGTKAEENGFPVGVERGIIWRGKCPSKAISPSGAVSHSVQQWRRTQVDTGFNYWVEWSMQPARGVLGMSTTRRGEAMALLVFHVKWIPRWVAFRSSCS